MSDGLIGIHTVVPDAIVDLRYASADNVIGVALYPAQARCLVHESLADGLRAAADTLHRRGLRLVIWDAYRPYPVQVRMFEAVGDPTFVARPTGHARGHTAGRSLDVTLAAADGTYLAMGTDFDSFTPQAAAHATHGVGPDERANRRILREAMAAGGLSVYRGEWWHFDGPGAGTPRPLLTTSLV